MYNVAGPVNTGLSEQDMSSNSPCNRPCPTVFAIGFIIIQLITTQSLFAAELFPLPSPNQERQQRSWAPAQLSQQDREKIAQLGKV